MSAQVAYVYTRGNHMQIGPGTNNVTTLLPAGASTTNAVPFPDFNHGSSYNITAGTSNYNSLQTKLEKQFANGLQFLASLHLVKGAWRCSGPVEWRKLSGLSRAGRARLRS